MKTKTLLTLALILSWTGILKAAPFMPGESPVFSAVMEEYDRDGHEIRRMSNKTLTMNALTGTPRVSSLVLKQTDLPQCPNGSRVCKPIVSTWHLYVTKIEKESCGSTVYTAVEKLVDLHYLPYKPKLAVKLVDHRSRLCEDYKKYMWELTVKNTDGMEVRKLYGNPRPVRQLD